MRATLIRPTALSPARMHRAVGARDVSWCALYALPARRLWARHAPWAARLPQPRRGWDATAALPKPLTPAKGQHLGPGRASRPTSAAVVRRRNRGTAPRLQNLKATCVVIPVSGECPFLFRFPIRTVRREGQREREGGGGWHWQLFFRDRDVCFLNFLLLHLPTGQRIHPPVLVTSGSTRKCPARDATLQLN